MILSLSVFLLQIKAKVDIYIGFIRQFKTKTNQNQSRSWFLPRTFVYHILAQLCIICYPQLCIICYLSVSQCIICYHICVSYVIHQKSGSCDALCNFTKFIINKPSPLFPQYNVLTHQFEPILWFLSSTTGRISPQKAQSKKHRMVNIG